MLGRDSQEVLVFVLLNDKPLVRQQDLNLGWKSKLNVVKRGKQVNGSSLSHRPLVEKHLHHFIPGSFHDLYCAVPFLRVLHLVLHFLTVWGHTTPWSRFTIWPWDGVRFSMAPLLLTMNYPLLLWFLLVVRLEAVTLRFIWGPGCENTMLETTMTI